MGKNKIIKVLGIVISGIGLVLAGTGLFLRTLEGKYNHISAEEKNAYITNIDLKTERPAVYISYDYEPERYIIGLLADSEYNENMKEGDWVSIYYDVENLRKITLTNPHKKSNCVVISGIILIIAGLVCVLSIICRKECEK
ncbi:MAG: hypothetical protein K6G09_10550 [Treponema sp.]|nr:hypothetical protein [Treponema sp.]